MVKSSDFGYVIATSDWYVIREKVEGDKVKIFIHQRKDGQELRPLGYMLGSNALVYEKRKDHGQ